MSASIRVSWKDEQLQSDIRRALTVAPKLIMGAVKESTFDVLGQAKENVKNTFNTTRREGQAHSGSFGTLGGSIGTKFTPAAFRGETGPAAIYGRIHELGGVIKPVHAQFLTFRLPDGQWVKTRRVVMPARPYMRPAFESMVPKIRKNFGNALRKALQIPPGGSD